MPDFSPDQSPDHNSADDEPQPTYISPSPPVKGTRPPGDESREMPLPMMPLRTNPNNSLPFILQKQQLMTKSQDGKSPTAHETTKVSNKDLKIF